MKRSLLLLSILALGCWEKTPPTPAPPPRLVLIFADVTSSLTPEQIVSVEKHVEHIIQALPAEATVHVFSISKDTETARELERQTAPTIESEASKNRLVEWRATLATKVQEDLEQLHQQRRETEPDTLSSCISCAFRRAATLINRSTGSVDVFIVSDMVEECATSILGGSVSLMKHDIRAEIAQAANLKEQVADLRDATVTLVRPQYNIVTSAQLKQPPPVDLERFWRALLSHCNTDPKNVFFGADLPSANELFPAAAASSQMTSK